MHNNSFLTKLTQVIVSNLHDEHFGVSQLAQEMGLNRTVLYRKTKKYTNKTTSQFITEIRLQKSKELLQDPSKTVSEVAYEVGFGSPSYFIKCFHDYYGYPPGERQKPKNIDSEKPTTEKGIKKKSWLIHASILLMAIVLTSAIYFLFYYSKEEAITIAVLPPEDISPDGFECIVLEGLRLSVQTSLYRIDGIHVVPSSITNSYRDSKKNPKTIGQELNANHIVEIRGRNIDNISTVWVEFFEASTGTQLYSSEYDVSMDIEEINKIQLEIATMVANELNIRINPNQQKEIEKLITQNPAAFREYQLGLLDLKNFFYSNSSRPDVINAKVHFEKAIELDSTFAEAYIKLAQIYIKDLPFVKYPGEGRLNYNRYLDSGLLILNKASAFEIKNEYEVKYLETCYYQFKGEYENAIKHFETLWKDLPKDFKYYEEKWFLIRDSEDYYDIIKNILYYLKLKPPEVETNLMAYRYLRSAFSSTNFPELAHKYNQENYEHHKDSALLIDQQKLIYLSNGDFDKAIKLQLQDYLKDTTNLNVLDWLCFFYYHKRDFENAFKYVQLYEKKALEEYNDTIRDATFGSLYLHFGMQEKANEHIQGSYEFCQRYINENVPFAQQKWVYGLLAGIHSLKGENEKALENLEIMASDRVTPSLVLWQIKQMPMYDNIRKEPEYERIIRKMEKSLKQEHERVKKLLIQQGLLPY